MISTTKSANLTTVSSFQTNSDLASSGEHWIVFDDIHSHCENCVKPLNCMQRLPKYSVNIPEKDVFSIMLDIDYHRSALGFGLSPPPCSPSKFSTTLPPPPNSPCPSSLNSSPISTSQAALNFSQSPVQSPSTSQIKKTVTESKSTIDKCPVIKCPNGDCQFIFHYCKLREHLFVCKFQKIKCLNCDYGCPFVLLRGNLASHLKHCPAMVVHCSMEWNRWPLHTTEKSLNTRVHCPSQALDTTNLDVALALRDQRMLKQLWSASRQMKRIMRGRLSVHPAVPIKPYIGIRTHREYSTSAPYLHPHANGNGSDSAIHRLTNGQGTDSGNAFDPSLNHNDGDFEPEMIVIHHDEEKYIRFAQNLIDCAYKDSLLEILKFTAHNYVRKCAEMQQKGAGAQFQRAKANSICPSTKSDLECFAQLQLSSSSSSINLPVLSDFFASEFRNSSIVENGVQVNSDPNEDGTTQKFQSIPQPPLPPPVPKCNALSLELSIWAYPFFNPKPRPMYTFRCGSHFRTDEIHSHARDIHSSIHGGLDGWIEYRCPLFQYGCPFVIRRWEPISGFGTSSSSSLPRTSCTSTLTSDSTVDNSLSGPKQTLIYNETLEAFACPQVDECVAPETPNRLCYESSLRSHNRSVSVTSNYNDNFPYFQGRFLNRRLSSNVGLNGRIESCSPSAKTTYSSASIFSGSRLSCPESPVWDSLQEFNLMDLPFELLQHICSYLDPFTLNSLSFTSHMLRSVVKTFLKHKGYVVLQWKRYEIEKGQYRWGVANKKWVFSTAISPITGWRMNSTSSMHEHLQICPFYNRIEHRHPSDQRFLDLTAVIKNDDQ